DAVAHEQIVRAMNGNPAIVRIPDARAEHAAAAHRVAHEMEMDRVLAEHALLAEMAELRVGNPAVTVAMIHRVAANAVGLCGFDDHTAREVRHFAACDAGAEMFVSQRLVQRERRAVEGADESLLRFHAARLANRLPIAAPAILAFPRYRHDDSV